MKKGQRVTGKVVAMEFPNKGWVLLSPEENEGITEPVRLRVANAVLGQKVECFVKRSRKEKAEGSLLSVLEFSDLEKNTDLCPHFGICGGCLFQRLPYDTEVELKQNLIRDLLLPVLEKETYLAVDEGIAKSPRWEHYRNKMEFTFGDEYKEGPLSLGLHKKNSFYDIVNTTGCRICEADMNRVLSVTTDYFRSREVSYYHRLRHTGFLRHLLVRQTVTKELLVDLITSGEEPVWRDPKGVEKQGTEELLEGWKDALLEEFGPQGITGILHTINTREADVVEDHGTRILYGRDYIEEQLLELTFKITPFSFFQTNSRGAEVLYSVVRDFIREAVDHPATVYDLYSGTGTIAQIMADVSDRVIGVEIVEEAVRAARENAQKNGLSNCEFLAGDVLKVLDEIREKPDFIILDPPRDGVHPKALKKILEYGVSSMIYIACKPSSLARDLPAFFAAGYEVRRLKAVDMFPRTANCEVCCLLTKTSC
ncbi:MAG: 23S rRNA (uracil(1939)-C(5))-methyltransferase RlmD [Lachnospiraceae bacterium]|nr:23S rRNA (uracil(1939)-C(5))-methyltransferase RlmD [Lachnospiraceae bacterium]